MKLTISKVQLAHGIGLLEIGADTLMQCTRVLVKE